MAKGKTFKQRFLSLLVTILMVAAMVVPSVPTYAAVADKIDVGQPSYDAVSGTMTYSNCLGTGANLYKSIVINFTSVRTNGEKAVLPTNMAGFTYETKLSTDGTYVINIPEGKNLVDIAAYIRKIKFLNCQNSSQKINFSIGRDIVRYMTFYSEDTGHYYQFIKFDHKLGGAAGKADGTGKTWQYGSWEYSYYTALDMQYEGLQGYLVTVSSIQEDFFIYQTSNEIGWMGGTRMNHGASDTKNGIPYYKTFTEPSGASDNAIGYWYWSCGPDVNVNGGKFLNAVKGTDALMRTADSNGMYNNWNSGEPNNSNVEFAMTTLKIGTGWSTGARSGKINSSSPYYKASGYSWNDISSTNMAQYGSSSVTDYTSTGFFVEYGDAVTGLTEAGQKAKTNFEFKTTTQPLSHIWNLYSPAGSDTIKMFCSAADPKCSYFATNESTLGVTIDMNIKTADVPYDGKVYNSATIDGDIAIKSAAGAANTTISPIKYFKVDGAGIYSGGQQLAGPPTDIGYYYAEVDVSVKNTKLASNTVTAKAVSTFKIYDPDADYAVDSLNNKQYSKEEVPYQRKVTSSTAYSDLQVVLATSSDTLSMYKIAEMPWNDSENTLNKIAWVPEVQEWISTSGYSKSAATPYDLANGKASSSTISAFYKDMLQNKGGVIVDSEGNATGLLQDLVVNNSPSQYNSMADVYVDAEGAEVASSADGATRYAVKFDNINYGIYAILAKAGSSSYAVTVAAVYPQQSGPQGNFFVQDMFTVYIKEVEPTIDKYINDAKEDIAEINNTDDPIEFRIDFQLPEYKDRLTSGEGSGYQLYFEDIMANGFTLLEGGDHDLKLYYLYEDEGEMKPELITQNGIPTSSPYKFTASPVSGSNGLTMDKAGDQIDYTNIITKNSDLVGNYYNRRENVRIFNDFIVENQEDGSLKIRIDFDEPALRAWKYNLKTTEQREPLGFRLVYYAYLDADAKINTNANSNIAYVYYEKDSSGGSMTEMHDAVYAYTYGLNIIKIDGSASERAYLAGAQFKLYKEVLGNLSPEEIEVIEADHENYYVLPGEGDASDRYFKKVVMDNGVFTQGSTGEFDTLVSVGNDKGITAHGLADGKYILVETKAPSGYNELAEDIYFEINRLTEDEEQLKTTDKSLVWFREMSDDYDATNPETAVINQNACISIDVYNYQGLTLPSTGGIGILLFVIIGTVLMGTVILIMLNRRRMEDNF
ncbi:LPXTG-motif cell wall anchor domain-containing protein [Pseudobutyrivibrio sp. OR37]|uniref:SpaA isopeptide-forming pilin-related protein n=1 Tax=Pseudobutyrivibrio sp. OR37 TaxID=1798186 RepID=UPI0008E8564B|nr:SpaA isopeptide-forming pilin-related protein [Pseudobutyrivibrio sp. OR37]SFH52964.1 LPXTG-motif cell wall anchor domain-containing protein [Pseudobutyrivibrio sp. OR37]